MTGNPPRKALVLGVNGQDGSYLAEQLCARGLDVTAPAASPSRAGR